MNWQHVSVENREAIIRSNFYLKYKNYIIVTSKGILFLLQYRILVKYLYLKTTSFLGSF